MGYYACWDVHCINIMALMTYGKTKMVAVIAAMRKLLCIMNIMIEIINSGNGVKVFGR